jgi:hypothetical protein
VSNFLSNFLSWIHGSRHKCDSRGGAAENIKLENENRVLRPNPRPNGLNP